MELITRKQALEQGLNLFFTGEPCKQGHVAERRVANSQCKECIAAYNKAHYEANRESAIERATQWQATNRERVNKRNKERYATDAEYKERVLARCAAEYEANRETVRAKQNAYAKANRSTLSRYQNDLYHRDPQHRAAVLLRGRLHRVLSRANAAKSAATLELLGTDKAGLIAHLEAQFTEGMTWENQGEWHIDHIKPCASFDLTDPEQQKLCFHYTNLQPLWGSENCSKGARLDWAA